MFACDLLFITESVESVLGSDFLSALLVSSLTGTIIRTVHDHWREACLALHTESEKFRIAEREPTESR